MLGYGDFDTVMDVVAKAVSKGPISWASSSPPPTWSSDRDCAGACCSSCCPSAPNSLAYVGRLAQRDRHCNAPKRRTRSSPRRKDVRPDVARRIPRHLLPHFTGARIPATLASR